MLKRMLVVTVGVMIGAAVVMTGPTEVAAQLVLTTAEAKALTKCQEAVAKGGQKFVATKLKLIEQCGTERVEVDLKCAAGDPKCLDNFFKTEELCFKKFSQIEPASTKFVDDVIEACQPVEGLIFGTEDPLAYQFLASVIGAIFGETPVITNVTELAGALCIGKEVLVDIMGTLEVPAGLDPFELLGIPLDPRCTISFGGDPV